jgi:4-hydroxy-2-oxoheptanedioate aldolase
MPTPIIENTFKRALIDGQLQLGAFMALADATAAELMANTDFDWLVIDGEHGPNDINSITRQLQALAAYPAKPVVRVKDHNLANIKQILDIGAQTLLIPMVGSSRQAAQLVKAVQYAPKGVRGLGGGLTRATRWGAITDYIHKAEHEICLVLQIESLEGLEELETITLTEGVDAIFIGPADLAASLGYPGQYSHPAVCLAVEQAIEKVHALGKPVGVFCGDPQQAQRYGQLGASFFLIGADTMLLRTAADQLVGRFRA